MAGELYEYDPADALTSDEAIEVFLADAFDTGDAHYIAKAEKKGRTREEVDEVILWLTGYGPAEFHERLEDRTDLETFYTDAPALNPARELIKGTICGIRVEEIEDPLMREIRYLDKLIDELAKGRPMAKILPPLRATLRSRVLTSGASQRGLLPISSTASACSMLAMPVLKATAARFDGS